MIRLYGQVGYVMTTPSTQLLLIWHARVVLLQLDAAISWRCGLRTAAWGVAGVGFLGGIGAPSLVD